MSKKKSTFLNPHKPNFETLQRASKNGDLALLETIDKASGKQVACIVAVSREGDEFIFTPLAKLFDGNPYDELEVTAGAVGLSHRNQRARLSPSPTMMPRARMHG